MAVSAAAASLAAWVSGRQLTHEVGLSATAYPFPVPLWATSGGPGCARLNTSYYLSSLEGEIIGSTDGTDTSGCRWTILPSTRTGLVAIDINTSESSFVSGDTLTFYALNAAGALPVGSFDSTNRLPSALRLLRQGARELHGMSLRLEASSSAERTGTSFFRMR